MSSETAATTRTRGRLLFATLFLASGAAGLIDQVVWLRYLSLVFGNTTLAAATLIAVFLGGLGAGAWWFARRLERGAAASPGARGLLATFTLYALLEAGIGLFALVSPRFFDLMNAAYVAVYRVAGDEPWLFALSRVLLAAICLLPPTFLMGGTLPVLLEAVRSGRGREGRDTALFYGANTLGAVAGVALAGFFTIRLFGLEASLLMSAAINFVVALLALGIARGRRAPAAAPEPGAPAPSRSVAPPAAASPGRALLVAAFWMGATSIACEVLWTRILVFYLGSSVYAFSLMLLLFLLGIAAGSLAAARLADRIERPVAVLAKLEIALALLAPVTIGLFATLNGRQIALSESLRPTDFATVLLAQLLAVAPILLPSTLLMGFTFPLVVRAYSHFGSRALGADVGRVYGANTAGSILGALAAGFALVPLVGSQNSLLLLGGGNALLAAWLAHRGSAVEPTAAGSPASRGVRFAALALLPALALLALVLPNDRAILAAGIFAKDQPGDLVLFREDASAAVAIRRLTDQAGPYLSLELNGVNVAGTSADLYAVQKMQGHLPMLLGRRDGARVVHIGFGSGGTAHAVSTYPVAEIRIVEISKAVLDASDRFFGDINHGVLADPRVRVEINDGRNFLLATPETFDAVLSDSIHPRYAGNGSLYSEEYFRLLDRRLAPGGVVSMWLPMYAMTPSNYAMVLRAFENVFPQAAVWYEPSALNSFTIVTARKGEAPWDANEMARGFADATVLEALADLGLRKPSDLLACHLVGGADLDRFLGDAPSHVDDLPAVEYESGTLMEANPSWLRNFSRLLEHRPAEPPAELLAAIPGVEHEAFRTRWRERGRLLELHRAAIPAGPAASHGPSSPADVAPAPPSAPTPAPPAAPSSGPPDRP